MNELSSTNGVSLPSLRGETEYIGSSYLARSIYEAFVYKIVSQPSLGWQNHPIVEGKHHCNECSVIVL